jgi:hypothetical protein
MSLPQCARSKDIIEPMLKPQWWVNCDKMGAAAFDAVRSGDLELVPSNFEVIWYRWLENIRDWCISRQLWWGHRIPAWYCTFSGETEEESGILGTPSEKEDRWIVGRSEEDARKEAVARYAPDDSRLRTTLFLLQEHNPKRTLFALGLRCVHMSAALVGPLKLCVVLCIQGGERGRGGYPGMSGGEGGSSDLLPIGRGSAEGGSCKVCPSLGQCFSMDLCSDMFSELLR